MHGGILSRKGSRGRITEPTVWLRLVGLAGLWHAAGAVGAVGAASQLENHSSVDQAVEERRCQRRVAEIVGPRGEVDIGRQRGRTSTGAGVEQAVGEGTGLGLRLTLQPVETEFVDQQQIEPRVL